MFLEHLNLEPNPTYPFFFVPRMCLLTYNVAGSEPTKDWSTLFHGAHSSHRCDIIVGVLVFGPNLEFQIGSIERLHEPFGFLKSKLLGDVKPNLESQY